MRAAIYNSAIPESIVKSVNRRQRCASSLRHAGFVVLIFLAMIAMPVAAVDWNAPEQQLARKIVAVTGPGAVALTVENRSSLGRRNSEIVQNGLRTALEQLGLRLVPAEQAAATVEISLSENLESYVWVAQIRQGAANSSVVMVSVPRAGGTATFHDSMPMTLRRNLLWTQDEPILDVAILEESASLVRIAVLGAEKVSIHRSQSGKWQEEQAMPIAHARPWPRDLRGRVILAKDHLLDVYLPGVTCHSGSAGALTLNCRDTDDPWPIVAGGLTGNSGGIGGDSKAVIPFEAAFFAPTRNLFTGVLTPSVGKFTNVAKFYSAALLPRDKYTLWLFAETDGQIDMLDGMNEQLAKFDWGSSIASVKTGCGAGWQVLATSSGDRANDSVRAYEFPDRDPVAVSAPLDLPGAVTALWTESKGDAAIAVVRNQDTGAYEAYRLAMACSQ